MGNDLSVINAARASFMKESQYLPGYKLAKPDIGLNNFLARDNHESPYRQAAARFELLTSLRQRLWIESALGNNRAGFVFKPDLFDVIGGADVDDDHKWRITGSLAGFVRLIKR